MEFDLSPPTRGQRSLSSRCITGFDKNGQVLAEGLEDALDDAAYEYLTAEGGERYPDGCSESKKRCIRKKAKSFVVQDGEMYYLKKVMVQRK